MASNATTTPARPSNKGSKASRLDFLSPSKLRYEPPERLSLWAYLRTEIFGVGETAGPQLSENDIILNFVRVPYQLESLLLLGWFMCLDAFLHVLTFLPVRVLFALALLANEVQLRAAQWVFGGFKFVSSSGAANNLWAVPRFHRRQLFDLMRGAMMGVAVFLLWQIDMGQVYHFIRGQNMIKLYVLAAMVEVMDKLFSSFGQDAFDALHTQTRTNPYSLNMCKYFVLTTIYVVLHSVLYFFEVATFTVVVNSSDEALLTVLVLNNFTEMKSFVFKKFDQNQLFQLACSDITERFQIVLFLLTILVVAIAQNDFQWGEILPSFSRIIALMLFGESVADCIKHAFINKFNSFNADLYKDFAFVLRLDVLSYQKNHNLLDRTYAIAKRFGMSQIPLGCVFIRYIILAISSSPMQQFTAPIPLLKIISAIFGALLFLKVVVGVSLILYADRAQQEAVKQFENKFETTGSSGTQNEVSLKKIELVEELLAIDRYTVYKGRVMS